MKPKLQWYLRRIAPVPKEEGDGRRTILNTQFESNEQVGGKRRQYNVSLDMKTQVPLI